MLASAWSSSSEARRRSSSTSRNIAWYSTLFLIRDCCSSSSRRRVLAASTSRSSSRRFRLQVLQRAAPAPPGRARCTISSASCLSSSRGIDSVRSDSRAHSRSARLSSTRMRISSFTDHPFLVGLAAQTKERRRRLSGHLRLPDTRSPDCARGTRWWAEQDLNLRPPACDADALPTELSALIILAASATPLPRRAAESRHPWAHLDLNQGPTGYEPAALTPELWAHAPQVQPRVGDRSKRPT